MYRQLPYLPQKRQEEHRWLQGKDFVSCSWKNKRQNPLFHQGILSASGSFSEPGSTIFRRRSRQLYHLPGGQFFLYRSGCRRSSQRHGNHSRPGWTRRYFLALRSSGNPKNIRAVSQQGKTTSSQSSKKKAGKQSRYQASYFWQTTDALFEIWSNESAGHRPVTTEIFPPSA